MWLKIIGILLGLSRHLRPATHPSTGTTSGTITENIRLLGIRRFQCGEGVGSVLNWNYGCGTVCGQFSEPVLLVEYKKKTRCLNKTDLSCFHDTAGFESEENT